MQALWASGGSVDLAARKLGLTYQVAEDSTYLLTILGRLYVNEREKRARALSIGPLAARRLLRNAERIEREFRDQFLPQFLVDLRLTEIADFDRSPRGSWLRRSFVYATALCTKHMLRSIPSTLPPGFM